MKDIIELNALFHKIKEIGWIKGTVNGYCDVGKTFEKLIGVEKNDFEIPDYKEIEIKTKRSKIHPYTTLFNCKPDGPFYMEAERLKDMYGYPDRDIPEYKVLNNSIFCNKFTTIGNKFKFKLEVDEAKEKVYLGIYDINENLIEKTTYWDFDSLEKKLYRKMKTLAYIHACKKYSNGVTYFKYDHIDFYKLKSFDHFIEAMKKGKIRVTFKICVEKKGEKLGKTSNHGTGFDIKEVDLLEIYDSISVNTLKGQEYQ